MTTRIARESINFRDLADTKYAAGKHLRAASIKYKSSRHHWAFQQQFILQRSFAGESASSIDTCYDAYSVYPLIFGSIPGISG